MANFRTLGTDFTAGLRAPHYTNGRLLTAENVFMSIIERSPASKAAASPATPAATAP